MLHQSERPLHAQRSQPAPDIDLRDAVIGDGIVLTHTSAGSTLLYSVAGDRVEYMGAFDNPGAAWAALDAFDEAA
jgi:hypothetical protein